MPSVIIQGKPLRLAVPRGFTNIRAVAPSIFEEYRRAQRVLALYIDSCHLGGTCSSAVQLLDPFIEVLMPESGSFVRTMTNEFFESCKFEVAQNILGAGCGSVLPAEASPRPQSVFADGPGWFSCCSLKYVKKADDPAKNDSFAPSVVGNIVFLIREHPIIVNLHKSADTNNPLESFNWLKNVTRDYRGLLLRINGLI